MKRKFLSFIFLLSLGFLDRAQATTWTWVNKSNNPVWIKADFLGCSLTKSCIEPFKLEPAGMPGDRKSINKGAHMLSFTQVAPSDVAFRPGVKYNSSKPHKNIPASLSERVFEIRYDKGLVMELKQTEITAKERISGMFINAKNKMQALFSRFKQEIQSIRGKITALGRKKKELETKKQALEKQNTPAAITARAKADIAIKEVAGQINMLEKKHATLEKQAVQVVQKELQEAEKQVNQLEKQAQTAQEKTDVNKMKQEIEDKKREIGTPENYKVVADRANQIVREHAQEFEELEYFSKERVDRIAELYEEKYKEKFPRSMFGYKE